MSVSLGGDLKSESSLVNITLVSVSQSRSSLVNLSPTICHWVMV